MEVTTATRDEALLFALAGSLDAKTAPDVERQILPRVEQSAKVLIDLSRTEYISSGGIRVLLLLYRQIKAMGGKIVLVGMSDDVTDVLSTTGLIGFFATAASVDEGLAALQ